MCYTDFMLDHEQPPNWVAERAKCRLDVIFEALIQVVERDVAEFNKLPCEQRLGRTSSVVCNGDGTSPILRVYRRDEDGSETSVAFTQNPTRILVQAPHYDPLILYPAWDTNRRTCLLMNRDNDIRYKVWELSQAALAPFLFD